jgi:hypothetical protein
VRQLMGTAVCMFLLTAVNSHCSATVYCRVNHLLWYSITTKKVVIVLHSHAPCVNSTCDPMHYCRLVGGCSI